MSQWRFTITPGKSNFRWAVIAARLLLAHGLSHSLEAAAEGEPRPLSPVAVEASRGEIIRAAPSERGEAQRGNRAHPLIGERLSFQGLWFGLPVGSGWLEVKGLVEMDGRPVYHLEAQGYSNALLSTFYPIQDVIHSYLDADTLTPIRVEKSQREGRYRAEEVVTFDHHAATATYRSLLNGTVKEIPIPEAFEDLISAIYWFRRQPLAPPETRQFHLYSDEKIYETTLQISAPSLLGLMNRGSFSCVMVEPKAAFRGLLVKRGRLWAYMTDDVARIPVLVKATTPWGLMSAVIDSDSLDMARVLWSSEDR